MKMLSGYCLEDDRSVPPDGLAALSGLFEAVADHAIVRLDRDGLIASWSGPSEAMFGWSAGEAIGHPAMLLTPNVPGWRGSSGLETGRSVECRRKDGSALTTLISLAPYRDAEGAVAGYWLVVRDVTADRVAASTIEASASLLKSILATVPDAMIVIDDHARIVSFSAAAEALFGYAEAEVIGRNVAMLMPLPDRERHDTFLAHYLETGERRIIGTARRVLGLRKDGSVFAHELHVAEAKGGGRRVFAGFVRDVTRREASAAQLAELQAELLHVARVAAMGTMASTLAHELNQPLTAIANYVETALAVVAAGDGDSSAVVREALAEAANEAHRAGDIIRRLRDFVARGALERSSELLPAIIDDACALGLGAGRGVVIERDVAGGAGPVLVDRVQVQQVLVNLLRNAIEAVPEGRQPVIHICARRVGGFVEVTMADNGRGLAPELGSRLFGAFVTTKRDGMGLGLSICRTIVEAHGGRIWARPLPVGTIFHFTLPRTSPDDCDD